MTDDHQSYSRVGRGGAGNFRRPIVDEDEKTSQAPDTQSTDRPAASARRSPPLYRVGRGGAGNTLSRAQPPAAPEEEDGAKDGHDDDGTGGLEPRPRGGRHPADAAAPRGTMGGRGGAGNWLGDEQAAGPSDGGAALAQLEDKVMEAVDQGLRVPEKAHRARD